MTLLVCRTCPRYQPETGAFGLALRAALATSDIPIRTVQCVGSCTRPGSVALDSSGKTRVRFSDVSAADIPAVLDAAAAHDASDTGHPDDWQIPDSLSHRISAITPKSVRGR
jgi:predicted metal-binding protein